MNKKYIIAVLLWSGLAIVAGYQLLMNTVIRSDMTVFMPRMDDSSLGLLAKSASDSPASRLWLLSLEGENPDRLVSINKALTQELRKTSSFVSVFNGQNMLSIDDEDILFKYRYLLDPQIHNETFSNEVLKTHLNERLAELRSPLSPFLKKWLPSDPTASYLHVLESMAQQSISTEYYDDVWVSEDKKQTFIIAQTHEPGMNLDSQEKIKTIIINSFSELVKQNEVKLIMSGSPNIALQTRASIKAESQRLSVVATIFMLIFLFWVYRSLGRVVITIIPLAGAILFATAIVSLLFGGIHGITLAFGITVLGIAVDYPIHVLSHADKGERLTETIVKIWPTMRLGVITTLLGYMAIAMADFPGLAQFGVFSVVGLLTAALITRTLIPGLINKAYESEPRLYFITEKLNLKPGKFIILAISLSIFLIFVLFVSTENYWSEDIAELSPIPKSIRTQDREIRQLLGVDEPRYLITVEADDLETLLVREEMLLPVLKHAIKDTELNGLSMAAQLLPSQAQQQRRQKLLPDKSYLENQLNQAMQGLPFRENIFAPFIEDITQAKKMPLLTAKLLHNTKIDSQLNGLLGQSEKGYYGLVRLMGMNQPMLLQQRLKKAAIPGVRFMDIKQSSSELISRFRQEAQARIAWAAGLMIIVLYIGVRNTRRLVRVILPVVCAVMVAATIPLGLGEKLNIFHLISLLLVAGISLDYGLFFSASRSLNDRQTLHALSVCAISTITVFGLLATASIPVLYSIGFTVATGVLAAFIFSWAFSRDFSCGNSATGER